MILMRKEKDRLKTYFSLLIIRQEQRKTEKEKLKLQVPFKNMLRNTQENVQILAYSMMNHDICITHVTINAVSFLTVGKLRNTEV